MSIAIVAVEAYVSYVLGYHIYKYINAIHSEPDLILITASIFLLLSAFKVIASLYGYYFVNHITERTSENS